ncbi:NAD-dependent epimerase/dehydratase family protein [Microbacterium sp. ASV81]|uniref:NAD-dependent epimerase/dehydratase family protein n=1 Tax=Microbacterium capsulatum TaxID=3041921 RepID=A0ABU0XGK1_9MICO|nr:NAD-dependent epimerase/dehydratase family protein [Microbacterium sp. ASV81]MDQ4214243.1 NAD-dependent epimerase/dehydratase family protein [Microbacterium sp. ASV81]
MSKIALTGANGFLGWHVRAATHAEGDEFAGIPVGDAFDADRAAALIDGSARAIHLAGVNRGPDENVATGNVRFAEQFASALRAAAEPPVVVVFANSTQVNNGSVYGDAKSRAAAIIAAAAEDVGAEFCDVRLPNLFGEHGQPFYNAVTATFCHLLARGEEPEVQQDRELTLLHAQDAADLLRGTISLEEGRARERRECVSSLLGRLSEIAALYTEGEIPDVSTAFGRDLFNTYRSYAFSRQAPIRLQPHADARGAFFEIVRTHGGNAQSSFSTTVPGVTRGDHYHRRKVERFTVLSGVGRISLRRLFTDEVVSFEISGEEPGAVDIPTLWAHNITNVGSEMLYTSFWTDDIFDPQNPDTIAEVV